MMGQYVARRLVEALPVLWLASVAIFVGVRLIPGDPALLVAGQDATPAQIAAARDELGMGQPVPVQYVAWLGRLASGDLGKSFVSKLPVRDLLAGAVPATLELAFSGLLVGVILGLVTGVAAALRPRSRIDFAVSAWNALVLGIPNFWYGILLILLFGLWLGWLPPGGRGDLRSSPGDWLRSIILPALALGMGLGATLSRYVRTTLLEVLGEDYLRTARAKGLGSASVLGHHALPNALIPVVTMLGLDFGRLLGGAVIIETVFSWPGMGRMVTNAIQSRDYPVVQAVIIILVAVFLLVNLATDLSYGFLDPRARVSRR